MIRCVKGSLGIAVICVCGFAASACMRRYDVRRDHLSRAELLARAGRTRIAVPALDREGRGTFVHYESVRQVGGVTASGWASVRASEPPRGLRVAGWVLGGVGAALLFFPFPHGGCGHDADTCIGVSVAFLGSGVVLVFLGYVLDDSEAPVPSPGMPRNLGDSVTGR